MDERAFYTDSQTTKPATLNCPYCRTQDTYELHWSVRKKKDRLPGGADERDRAKFAKAQSYMVLLDDKVADFASEFRATVLERQLPPFAGVPNRFRALRSLTLAAQKA